MKNESNFTTKSPERRMIGCQLAITDIEELDRLCELELQRTHYPCNRSHMLRWLILQAIRRHRQTGLLPHQSAYVNAPVDPNSPDPVPAGR